MHLLGVAFSELRGVGVPPDRDTQESIARLDGKGCMFRRHDLHKGRTEALFHI